MFAGEVRARAWQAARLPQEGFVEWPQLLHYEPGQWYKTHRDTFHNYEPPDASGQLRVWLDWLRAALADAAAGRGPPRPTAAVAPRAAAIAHRRAPPPRASDNDGAAVAAAAATAAAVPAVLRADLVPEESDFQLALCARLAAGDGAALGDDWTGWLAAAIHSAHLTVIRNC